MLDTHQDTFPSKVWISALILSETFCFTSHSAAVCFCIWQSVTEDPKWFLPLLPQLSYCCRVLITVTDCHLSPVVPSSVSVPFTRHLSLQLKCSHFSPSHLNWWKQHQTRTVNVTSDPVIAFVEVWVCERFEIITSFLSLYLQTNAAAISCLSR